LSRVKDVGIRGEKVDAFSNCVMSAIVRKARKMCMTMQPPLEGIYTIKNSLQVQRKRTFEEDWCSNTPQAFVGSGLEEGVMLRNKQMELTHMVSNYNRL
jgi:hypothetical protein